MLHRSDAACKCIRAYLILSVSMGNCLDSENEKQVKQHMFNVCICTADVSIHMITMIVKLNMTLTSENTLWVPMSFFLNLERHESSMVAKIVKQFKH